MMTECERIIKQGILPESFFEEEVRCDFLVTQERKKIWAVLLDLLMKFDFVCKKHGLTYYLTDGTLLGAIRHKGFIPWDDDIDVSMPREDYEKLQTLGYEFTHPYFLQTPYTDSGYYYSFVKLRNSNTTGLSKAFMYQGFNDGLFLDVLPLDEVDIEQGEAVYNKLRELVISNSAYMKLSNPNYSESEMEKIKQLASDNPLKTYNEITKLTTMFNGSGSRYISHWVTTMDPFQKKVWFSEDFDNTIEWKFEGLGFPIPCGFHRYLSLYFGEYMQLPPFELRGNRHNNAIFDPDCPYTEYQTRGIM
jgi:lipopolysaccharide cholinephosphotransferase